MGAVIDGLVISFATAADEEWMVRNDSNQYINPQLVSEKVAARGYIVARIHGDIVGTVRRSTFWSFIPMIDIIAVEAPQRRKGVGRALLSFFGGSRSR